MLFVSCGKPTNNDFIKAEAIIEAKSASDNFECKYRKSWNAFIRHWSLSADDGTSGDGHWNPTNENHGKWGTSPYHLGDITV